MYRRFLFILYAVILLLSFFSNIILLNYPLQTLLVAVSLFFGFPIFFRSIKEILFNKNYITLRYYLLFYILLIIMLICHDLITQKSTGILKAFSILIYLIYSIVLVYLLKSRKYLAITLKLFSFVLISYIIGYIFNYTPGEQIDFFIFKTRTNLAWFLLFLYVLTLNNFSKKIKVLQSVIILGLLLINSSRGPVLAFIIINIYIYRNFFLSKKNYGLKLISFPLLILSFYSIPNYFSYTAERFVNILNSDYRSSTGYRLSVIFDSFNYALENLFGNGYHSFVDIFGEISSLDLSSKNGEFSADNSYIEILIDTGWLPLVLLILFFYKFLKTKNNNMIFLIFLSALMLFDSIMYNNFWTLLIISTLVINANSIKFKNKLL